VADPGGRLRNRRARGHEPSSARGTTSA